MTKTEFLQQLYNHLQPISPNERDEVIQDFEEHFSVGIENGKTEEQICAELGNPYNCALQYIRQTPASGNTASSNQTQSNNTASQTNANNMYGQKQAYTVNNAPVENVYERRNRFLWGLMFFFFVFCALGVYPASIGLMVAPIVVAFGGVFAIAVIPSGLMIALFVSVCVGLFAAGLLMFLLMTWLLKISFKRSGF